jgi:uncharacterized protein
MGDDEVIIPATGPMRWLTRPVSHIAPQDRLELTAGPGTDRFVDPRSRDPKLDSPALLRPEPDEDYVFTARATVEFAATFDAGVLLLWSGPDRFAKLCFEYSQQHERMVVSVVTRETSDDANGATVDGNRCWLRIARVDQTYAFHSSIDGRRWDLTRYFELGTGPASVGFSAQSPTGHGCWVGFDLIRFERRTLTDLRDGS